MADYPGTIENPSIVEAAGDDVPGHVVRLAALSTAAVDPGSLRVTLSHAIVGVLVAIDAGAWQPGYAGTIVANGEGGYDVEITTHPPLFGGTWTVEVTAETYPEAGGELVDSWSFSVAAGDPPAVSGAAPSGIATVAPAVIGCTVTHEYGLLLSTLRLVARPSVGAALVAIAGGVVQAGWGGAIVTSGGAYPVQVTIALRPPVGALTNGRLWTFELDCQATTGATL